MSSSSTTTVKVPCFDHLQMVRDNHYYKKEAKFELDLRSLINQLIKKLQKQKKMLKKMKKKSKKGKDQIQLTKWRWESRSPLASHSSKSQRWMLFRASWDLWKVIKNTYGDNFSFRIEPNSSEKSIIKFNLFLSWKAKRHSSPEIMNTFKKPKHLSYDPRMSSPRFQEINTNAKQSNYESQSNSVPPEYQKFVKERFDLGTSMSHSEMGRLSDGDGDESSSGSDLDN